MPWLSVLSGCLAAACLPGTAGLLLKGTLEGSSSLKLGEWVVLAVAGSHSFVKTALTVGSTSSGPAKFFDDFDALQYELVIDTQWPDQRAKDFVVPSVPQPCRGSLRPSNVSGSKRLGSNKSSKLWQGKQTGRARTRPYVWFVILSACEPKEGTKPAPLPPGLWYELHISGEEDELELASDVNWPRILAIVPSVASAAVLAYVYSVAHTISRDRLHCALALVVSTVAVLLVSAMNWAYFTAIACTGRPSRPLLSVMLVVEPVIDWALATVVVACSLWRSTHDSERGIWLSVLCLTCELLLRLGSMPQNPERVPVYIERLRASTHAWNGPRWTAGLAWMVIMMSIAQRRSTEASLDIVPDKKYRRKSKPDSSLEHGRSRAPSKWSLLAPSLLATVGLLGRDLVRVLCLAVSIQWRTLVGSVARPLVQSVTFGTLLCTEAFGGLDARKLFWRRLRRCVRMSNLFLVLVLSCLFMIVGVLRNLPARGEMADTVAVDDVVNMTAKEVDFLKKQMADMEQANIKLKAQVEDARREAVRNLDMSDAAHALLRGSWHKQSAMEAWAMRDSDAWPLIDMLIFTITHSNHTERRDATRASWRNYMNHSKCAICTNRSVRHVFVLAGSARDVVAREADAHGDMLFTNGTSEGKQGESDYSRTFRKVLLAMYTCSRMLQLRFRLLAKVDDDSYVFMDRLLKVLGSENAFNRSALYLGDFQTGNGAKPNQDNKSKWYDPEWVPHTNLPNYPWHAKGAGYIISQDLVYALVQMTLEHLDMLWEVSRGGGREDVMIGVLLLSFRATRIQLPLSINPKCKFNDTIVLDHYVKPDEMVSRWREYEKHGDPCWGRLEPEVKTLGNSTTRTVRPRSRTSRRMLAIVCYVLGCFLCACCVPIVCVLACAAMSQNPGNPDGA